MQDKDVGTFIVRDSLSNPGSFVLTVRIPEGIKAGNVGSYLVEKHSAGFYKIKVCRLSYFFEVFLCFLSLLLFYVFAM